MLQGAELHLCITVARQDWRFKKTEKKKVSLKLYAFSVGLLFLFLSLTTEICFINNILLEMHQYEKNGQYVY